MVMAGRLNMAGRVFQSTMPKQASNQGERQTANHTQQDHQRSAACASTEMKTMIQRSVDQDVEAAGHKDQSQRAQQSQNHEPSSNMGNACHQFGQYGG